MEDIKFASITDLYRRVYPALETKKDEINNQFHSKVTELDIWNYLKNNVWNKSKNLSLCDIVDDILHINEDDMYFYIRRKYENGGNNDNNRTNREKFNR
jgi:hypothetical protein